MGKTYAIDRFTPDGFGGLNWVSQKHAGDDYDTALAILESDKACGLIVKLRAVYFVGV